MPGPLVSCQAIYVFVVAVFVGVNVVNTQACYYHCWQTHWPIMVLPCICGNPWPIQQAHLLSRLSTFSHTTTPLWKAVNTTTMPARGGIHSVCSHFTCQSWENIPRYFTRIITYFMKKAICELCQINGNVIDSKSIFFKSFVDAWKLNIKVPRWAGFMFWQFKSLNERENSILKIDNGNCKLMV